MKSFFHSLASALISVPVALALSVLALGPGVHAASFPAAKTVALAVDPTTGEIKGPVDAETFKSANNLGGGGGGGGSYSFTLPLLDTLGTVSIRTANATQSGALSSSDWSLFNGKVPATRTVNGHALSADVTVTKGDVGLGNVDNTSDAAKPVSTAQQTALDGKVPVTRTVNGHALSADITVTKGDVGLGNVDNTSDANKPISNATQTALNGKFSNIIVSGQNTVSAGTTNGNVTLAGGTGITITTDNTTNTVTFTCTISGNGTGNVTGSSLTSGHVVVGTGGSGVAASNITISGDDITVPGNLTVGNFTTNNFTINGTITWGTTLVPVANGGLGADNSAASGVPIFSGGSVTMTSTTGTGSVVRAGGAIGSATATTQAAGDASTKVATTKYVDDADAAQASTLLSVITSKVSDTAYDASLWDGVTGTAPSKNAVRDKIEALAAQTRTVVFYLTIDALADSMNYGTTFVPANFTISEIRAVHVGSTSSPSVLLKVYKGTDRSSGTAVVTAGNTITSTTTGNSTTTFDSASVAANSFIWITTASKSGTTDRLEVAVRGTYD